MADDFVEGIPRFWWRYAFVLDTAVSVLVSGVVAQALSRSIQGSVGIEMHRAATTLLDEWEEEYCATPHPPVPVLDIVAGLADFAKALPEESSLREGTLDVARRLSNRMLGGAKNVER